MPIYFHETIDIVAGPGNLYQYHDEIERIVTDHVNAAGCPSRCSMRCELGNGLGHRQVAGDRWAMGISRLGALRAGFHR